MSESINTRLIVAGLEATYRALAEPPIADLPRIERPDTADDGEDEIERARR